MGGYPWGLSDTNIWGFTWLIYKKKIATEAYLIVYSMDNSEHSSQGFSALEGGAWDEMRGRGCSIGTDVWDISGGEIIRACAVPQQEVPNKKLHSWNGKTFLGEISTKVKMYLLFCWLELAEFWACTRQTCISRTIVGQLKSSYSATQKWMP